MKIVKFNTILASVVICAAQNWREGNERQSSGKKLSDAGKETLANLLETERNINVDNLPIGECVSVQDENGKEICRVEIGKQNRLNAKKLAIENPKIILQYTEPMKTVYYK